MKKSLSSSIRTALLLLTCLTLLVPALAAWAALGITGVTPSVVVNNVATTLVISGADFVNGAQVSLDGYGDLTTAYINSTTLSAALPTGVAAGVYTVRVTNPDSTSIALAGGLTVMVPTVSPSETPTPGSPGNYERPLIVIYSYDASQDTLNPGDHFTLNMKLYNAGQKYATNVVATFITGEFIPRETGGVIAVGDIAPDNRADLSQPLTVNPEIWGQANASLTMSVSYTDQAGVSYTETFVLNFSIHTPYGVAPSPTPTPTATPTPMPVALRRPQLVITEYSTDVEPLQPGMPFNLQITLQNVGNAQANHVTMITGGGDSSSGGTSVPGGVSGAGGEFTNFAPLGSSNVQSLGNLAAGATLDAGQALIVNVNTSPGAYPMKISFAYTDDNNQAYTDDQVITLLVYLRPLVEISFYMDPGMPMAGQPNLLPLQIVNLGRKSVILGNLRVEAENADLMNNVILIGTLESGGYFTLDATYIPYMAGPTNLIVTVDYTDDFNQPQVITQTIPIEVMEGYIPEPDDGSGGFDDGNGEPIQPEEPETILQAIWRFILGLLGLDSSPSTPSGTGTFEEYPLEGGGEVFPVQPPLKGP